MKIRFNPHRTAPNLDQGIKVPYAAPQRQAFRLRWYLILLLISTPLLYLAVRALLSLWLIEAPGYVALQVYDISAPQAGQVARLLAHDSQPVRHGQPLLELRQPELEARLAILRQRLATPSRPASLRRDDAVVLSLLRQNLARYQRLFDAGAATRGELDAARLRLDEAQAARPMPSRDNNEQQRRDWRWQLAEAEALQQSLLVRAPADGTVLRVETQPGLSVQAGQTLLALQQRGTARVVALLPPRHASYARAGQRATVFWPSGEQAAARVLYNGSISAKVPEALRSYGDLHQGVLVQLELLSMPPAWLQVNNMAVNVRFPHELRF